MAQNWKQKTQIAQKLTIPLETVYTGRLITQKVQRALISNEATFCIQMALCPISIPI